MIPLSDVLLRLKNARRCADGWRAKCPAHDGRTNSSLAIAAGDNGEALLFCFGGCGFADIASALGLADCLRRPGGERKPRIKRVPLASAAERDDSFALSASRWATAATDSMVAGLAAQLGVSAHSLRRLGIGWNGWAWSFPMRDEAGHVVGIRLRKTNGEKLSVKGGREGLFIPSAMEPKARLYIVEGPSDTAAMLDCELNAIGRPCCRGAVAATVDYAKGGNVVVVADNDEAGRDGAERLAVALVAVCPDVRIILPPNGVKDVRELLNRSRYPSDAASAIWAAVQAAAPLRLAVRGVRR